VEVVSGVLILVVGPSGAGKDTLLAGAATRLSDGGYVFPRRVITRPDDAGGEEHVAVSPEEFERRSRTGAFALAWRAHGNAYGIPAAIEGDLAAGRHVVVNVSRTVIGDARRRFARVGVVLVLAPQESLKARLTARGREDEDAVERRLDRASRHDVAGEGVVEVVNDGTVEEGIARFVEALRRLVQC
jgi:ribose 1,5-bisphosphokinase